GETGLPVWITLPILFIMVATVMTTVAEGVARRFRKFKSLDAYRLDVLGSIAGIIVFSLISFSNAPPIVWGLIVCLCFLVLNGPKHRGSLFWTSIVGIIIVLGAESLIPSTFWSPYYKI